MAEEKKSSNSVPSTSNYLITVEHNSVNWFHDAAHQDPTDETLTADPDNNQWTGVVCDIDIIGPKRRDTGVIIQYVHSRDDTIKRKFLGATGQQHVFENWQVVEGKMKDGKEGDSQLVASKAAIESYGFYEMTSKLYYVTDDKPGQYRMQPDVMCTALGLTDWDVLVGEAFVGYGKKFVGDLPELKADDIQLRSLKWADANPNSPEATEARVPDPNNPTSKKTADGKSLETKYYPDALEGDLLNVEVKSQSPKYRGIHTVEQPDLKDRKKAPQNQRKRSVTIDWDKPNVTRKVILTMMTNKSGASEQEAKNYKPELEYELTIHNSPVAVANLLSNRAANTDHPYTSNEVKQLVTSKYFPHVDVNDVKMSTSYDPSNPFVKLKIDVEGTHEPDDNDDDKENNDDDDNNNGGDNDDKQNDDDDDSIYDDPDNPDDGDPPRGQKRPRDDDIIDMTHGDSKDDPIVLDDALMNSNNNSSIPKDELVDELYNLQEYKSFQNELQLLQAEQEAVVDHIMSVVHHKGQMPSIKGRTYKGLTSWRCRAMKNKGKGPRCTQFTRERFPFCNFHSRHTGGRIDKELNKYSKVDGKRKLEAVGSRLIAHQSFKPKQLVGLLHSAVSHRAAHANCQINQLHDKAKQYWSSKYLKDNDGEIKDTDLDLAVDFSVPNSSSIGRYAALVDETNLDADANTMAYLSKIPVTYTDCTTVKTIQRPVIAMIATKAIQSGTPISLEITKDENLEVVECDDAK